MRVAFVGKGGSGKTTLASLFTQHLLHTGRPALAIDADINQHLAFALDRAALNPLPLGHHIPRLKSLLCGSGPRTADTMIKTSLPQAGSHLVRLVADDPVMTAFAQRDGNLYVMRTGHTDSDDVGIRCFHAKTGAVELVLNHLVDAPDDWTVVDMTAGADAFASGLFTRFDLTIAVVEPTLQSVGVFKQYQQQAEPYDVIVKAVGNKLQSQRDHDFLAQQCGPDLLAVVPHSNWVKQREQGESAAFDALEPSIVAVLQNIREAVQAMPRDWQQYWQTAAHFHVQNARSWGNQAVGRNIENDIDAAFLSRFHQTAQHRRSV